MRGLSQLPALGPYWWRVIPLSAVFLVLSGCIGSELVPEGMEPQIARDVSFESLKAEPDKFKGRLVVLGGKVLGAKRLKDGTQIEVLQLPLDKADAPILMLPRSQGRFLAYQEAFLDPATIPEGTAVSMVAEVTGTRTLPLDEVDYTYPTLKVRTLKVWAEDHYTLYWPGPYYLYFYRYPYHPFYPYWWDPWY